MDTDPSPQPRSLVIGQALPPAWDEDDPVLAVAKRPGDLSLHWARLVAADDPEDHWSALVDLFLASSPEQSSARHQALNEGRSHLTPEKARFLRAAVESGLGRTAPHPACAGSLLTNGIVEGLPLTTGPETLSDTEPAIIPHDDPRPVRAPGDAPTVIRPDHTHNEPTPDPHSRRGHPAKIGIVATAAAIIAVVVTVAVWPRGDGGSKTTAPPQSSTVPAQTTSSDQSDTTAAATTGFRDISTEVADIAAGSAEAALAVILEGADSDELDDFSRDSPSTGAIIGARNALAGAWTPRLPGQLTARPRDVRLDGDRAVVELDVDVAGLTLTRDDGTVFHVSSDSFHMTATLRNEDGTWRVSELTPFR